MSEGLKQKIQKEIDGNVQMLRSKDPKSERRISVLHARIEMLTWVRKELDEAAKQIRKDLENRLLNYIHSCGYYLGDQKRDRQNIKAILNDVLGVDEKEKARA